jgi:hypothetical protein
MAKVKKKTIRKRPKKSESIEKSNARLAEITEALDLKPVKKNGRPTKYEAWMDAEVEAALARGLSKEACAGVLGICADTLFRWIKENESFSYAIKRGQEMSRLFWEDAAMKHLTYSPKGKRIESTLWIFNMKNRFNWTDKKEVDVEVGPNTRKAFGFKLDISPDLLDESPDEPNND